MPVTADRHIEATFGLLGPFADGNAGPGGAAAA